MKTYYVDPVTGQISFLLNQGEPQPFSWNRLSQLKYFFTEELEQLAKELDWPDGFIDLARQSGVRLSELDFRPRTFDKNMQLCLDRALELLTVPPMLQIREYLAYRRGHVEKYHERVKARRAEREPIEAQLAAEKARTKGRLDPEDIDPSDSFGGNWAIHAVSKDSQTTLILFEPSDMVPAMGRLRWTNHPVERDGKMLPGEWAHPDDENIKGQSDWSFWANPSTDIIRNRSGEGRALSPSPFQTRNQPSVPAVWKLYLDPEFLKEFTIEVGLLSELNWTGKPESLYEDEEDE